MNDKQQLPDDIETPIFGMPPLPCCTNCDGSGMVRAYETHAWMTCQFCKGTGIAPFASGCGTHIVAFDARTIVEAKAAALRSMAVMEVRAITAMGLLFVRSAGNIRWTEAEPFGAVRAGGEWIPLTVLGLETWAVEEGLNWRRDDGTVVFWSESGAVGGGGGGGIDEVLSSDDAILIDEAMHYLTAMRTETMDDMSIHTLLTVGAFLMSPHNQSLQRAAVEAADQFFSSFVPVTTGGSGGGGVREEPPYIQAKTLRQAGILSVADMQYADQQIEDHLNDGWSIVNVTYLDAANVRFVLLQREMVGGGGGDPDGQHKPLHSMTADEARIYAIETHKRIKEMIVELNTIPGVNASSKLVVVFPDEERIPVLEVDDVMGDTYIVKTTDEAVSLVREMLEDWETFDVNEEIVVRVSLAHPDEIAALQMDEGGEA